MVAGPEREDVGGMGPRPLFASAVRGWLVVVLAATTVLAAVDALAGTGVVLITPLVLAPPAAAVRLRPRAVVGVSVYAIVLALGLGLVDGIFGTARHLVAVVAVAGAAALATAIASTRERLESERRRASALLARERFLADAGAVLDRSLNPDETLREIAALAVPARAAMCVIDVLDEDGPIRGVAVAAREPAIAARMRQLREGFPLDPAGPHPVAQVVRSERPLLIQLDDPTLSDIAASGEHLEFMRRAGYRSAIVVPLRARNRTYGTISWLRFADEPPYDEDDLALVAELGRRAALALSNAHLFSEARQARQRSEHAFAEASAARERADFLAEASVLLDASLDVDTTLGDLARLVVPRMADWCAVDVPTLDGGTRNVAVVHRDPEKVALATRLRERYPQPAGGPTGVPNVMRTGEPEFYSELDDALLRDAARNDEHLEMLRSLGIGSAMVVPLRARGRTLGVLTLIAEGPRRFDESDLTRACDLAARAALSVDNARLYEERTHVARTLQATLLPPELPAVPRMRVAARYRPAAEGVEVGGDFYDAFPAGRERWALVVGDVCGKGAEAAAVTALARYTLRAEAARGLAPVDALARLNDALLRQRDDGRFLTLAYATLDPEADGLRFTVACAGHPPAILVRADGRAELLGGPGSLLGVFADPTFRETSTLLEPADSAVLYTDGAIEGNPENRMQPSELAARLVGHGGAAPDRIALAVERAAAGEEGARLRDDLAVLVAQREVAEPVQPGAGG